MIVRDSCPICGEPAVPLFSWPFDSAELASTIQRLPAELGTPFLAQDFEVRRCLDCDLAFQRLVPDEAAANSIYSLHPDEAAIREEISAQKLHWFAHLAEELLVVRQMVPSPSPRVLDFGCNWGKWASMALAFGCDVEAVEINSVAVAFCEARGIRIVQADRLQAGRYDFINLDQVLEHVTDPRALIGQLARTLAPGGYLKVSTPHAAHLPAALETAQRRRDGSVLRSGDIDALEPLVHLNLFSNCSLRAIARSAGLEVARLPFFKWLGAAQMWNLPRQLGRNLSVPRKRWLGQGTYLWLQNPREAGRP